MKKLISATLAATLAPSLAACGSTASTTETASSEAASTESTAASSEAAESTAETSELAGTTLKVAASPTPHAEILNVAKEVLAEQGIDIDADLTFCGIAVLFCGFHHLSSQPLLCCCRQSLSPPGIS